ncbi:DNA repair ATPase [Mycolicibacterium chubuense]|uniref:DNA repair ATPase n=1 Tax=Mycolicibacterium chubuense TaxID=1800 RepID=A0A0J6WMM2_MYCCU|nr:DUF349 domain-containing protein [Mycolicibacterium chubuense]KMO82967.1 hypothetical protein MCHUDSM44219_01492 [Mycolicibacterium chubuense]ORA53912.1 DNA repair ATPase [Mycolicibacterium chubuense]SPX95381.1 protein of uncharacterised function (DUF349) [Mycolicibacterium chubuense]
MTITEPGGSSEAGQQEPDPTPSPAPTPGPSSSRPKPGPARPGPRPAPPVAAAVVAAVPSSDPHRFGRVDPDGTVWLITAAGERTIGSWQAGDAEAAYVHFGRRFDDLQTEVVLLERRLASGSGDARKIRSAASALAESLPEAHVLGDVDALAARLAAIVEQAEGASQEEKAKREELRAQQTARKEALAAEAEELAATASQWKAAGDRLRAILDEWKTISGVDRKTDDALWKRYSAARETFNRRRGSHFAELDRERAGARQAKEALCVRAEELCDSTDWGPTSAVFRDLLGEWKAAGRAAKDVDDALWQRFKSAQDRFFSARNAATAERDAEFRANADAKEALLVEAERLDPADREASRAALRAIGDKWDAIGKVPRERAAELERRMRAVEKKIRDAPTGGVDPEAQARADQFRERAEQFERQADKAEAAGRTKDAEQARANAEQWRQWAEAAADALGRKR